MSHEPINAVRCRMCWELTQDCECPTVTAIMPTRGRPDLATQAVTYFQAQTWLKRELVILDDADCPSFGHPPQGFRYERIDGHQSIGAKRNALCEMARGQIICHWDDDDWSAPSRIADLVKVFTEAPGVQVYGFHSMHFWDAVTREAWMYSWRRKYAVGTSLAYRKDWWSAHPFEKKSFMEDSQFVTEALGVEGALHPELADARMVARYHGGNTTQKEPNGAWFRSPQWSKCDVSDLPAGFPR